MRHYGAKIKAYSFSFTSTFFKKKLYSILLKRLHLLLSRLFSVFVSKATFEMPLIFLCPSLLLSRCCICTAYENFWGDMCFLIRKACLPTAILVFKSVVHLESSVVTLSGYFKRGNCSTVVQSFASLGFILIGCNLYFGLTFVNRQVKSWKNHILCKKVSLFSVNTALL